MEDKQRQMLQTAISNEEQRIADVKIALQKAIDERECINIAFKAKDAALAERIATMQKSIEGSERLISLNKSKLNQ